MVSQISSLLRFPLAIALALLMFLAPGDGVPVRAADFTVNSAADAVDASPGDGVCDDGAGNCTLRAAIQEANALAGSDTITLPAGTYTVTIVGGGEGNAATGDLDINDDLTIIGAGADTTIIDGEAGNDRVFEVVSGSASISGVSIQDGEGDVGFGCECGGGILVGAAATLTLTDSTVSSNTATGGITFTGGPEPTGGMTHTGGGIHNDGTLSLSNTTVSDNLARGEDFTPFGVGVGGGIFNSDGSALTVSDSTVSGNTATGFGGGGGGIDNEGTLTVNNSAVSDNTSTNGGGGGIRNEGTLTLTNSTVGRNMAITSDGGGIFNLGDAVLSNVTISGNAGAVGGAIYNRRDIVLESDGTMTVTNGTVSNNTSEVSLTAILNDGSITLKNTIVANSLGLQVNCHDITSAGHNLDSDGTCSLVGRGDLSNLDAKLGPLADNGGPTQTHALLSGSPAIDAGDNATCPATDQRGAARPHGAACDIGAYEAGGTPPAPSADQLPVAGGEPASGGGGRTLTIVVLAAVALGLAVAGASLVGVSRRY